MAATTSSNTALFSTHVSYTTVNSGPDMEKPLILYLHGFKQNAPYLQKRCAALLEVDAYHVFIQAPYPIYDPQHARPLEEWGRAWYMYDGEAELFKKGLAEGAELVVSVLNTVCSRHPVSQAAVWGYSMGGYLAGYTALSRPDLFDDLVVVGGRIKTEIFKNGSYSGLRVLHLHGAKDTSVELKPAQKSARELSALGAEVTFEEVNEGHRLNDTYINKTKTWFSTKKS